MAVYLSGIVIGSIYTPAVMSYAKELNAQKTEEQQIQQKPEKSKKTRAHIKQVV
jgi:hypothetical protein